MSQFQRLLLIAKPDTSRSPAFERAVALAKTSGANLHIALFVYTETIAAMSRIDREGMEQARSAYVAVQHEWLQEEVVILRSQGLQASAEVVWCKHPLEEILTHVQTLPADLLIKDINPETAIKRAFITPLDWQLLRRCPVPVHLVADSHHALPQKVVAAVDPLVDAKEATDFNDQIIRTAAELARQCAAELHLLYACNAMADQPFPTATLNLPWFGDLQKKMKTASQDAFRLLAERHGIAEKQRHFLLGPVVPTIADYATRSEADVVVMGTTLHRGLQREMMGSTCESLLYRLPCSALVIHPEGVVSKEK